MADYRALAEQDSVGRCVVRNGRFVYTNPQFTALVEGEDDSLLERDPLAVFGVVGAERSDTVSDPADADDGTDHAVTNTAKDVESILSGDVSPPTDPFTHEVTLSGTDGYTVDATVRFSRLDYDGAPATLCVVLATTPSRGHTISVLERATAELVRATNREEVCSVAADTAAEVLGFEVVSVHTLERGALAPTVSNWNATIRMPPISDSDNPIWQALFRGETRVVPGEAVGLDAGLDVLCVPLGDGELLLAASTADHLHDATMEMVSLLATNVEAALDRVRREERLQRLHEATRELMAAETERDVADVAIATTRDVLRHDICGVHLYDEDEDALVPVATSRRTREFVGGDDGVPSLRRGESLSFDAFEAGETRVYDDVTQTKNVMDPETRLRSELIVPLGDRGIFIAGSVLPDYFDETDVSLAKVLCANVEAALERAEREAAFRSQGEELRERNGRLDEFASVVSHDLRNPLNVAEGRLELAREACSCGDAEEHLETVARNHDRMGELIDDLLTLARQGRGVGDTEPVDVGEVARRCWDAFGEGELDVVDEVRVEADESRLRELLENLVRNSLEHAGPAPSVRLGALRESDVDADGSEIADENRNVVGFYFEDDGPGIPEAEREQVFEDGYSTDPDGTGFGLSIVRAIADGHGWHVEATEGTRGGARFEVRF